MRDEACDVLVVGLGPAGAAAATVAAKAGARVVAIDSRTPSAGFARLPEFVPFPVGRHAGADRVVIQSIVGARGHLADGTQVDQGVRGCIVDRGFFDRALVDFAAAAGAELWRAATLASLDADASVATISDAGGTRPVRFRALIAADGHTSTVARLLGMNTLKTVNTKSYRVALQMPWQTIDAWVSHQHPGRYGWLIPAGQEAIIGSVMAAEAAEEAAEEGTEDSLDALHRQLEGSGIVGREIRARASGTVVVGGMRERLVWGNILFAGDAAGLAHPLTGAGICQAVVSGEAAGRAAAEWSAGRLGAIPDYEAKMRGQFGETMDNALRQREPLESHGRAASVEWDPNAIGWSVVRGAFES